MPDTLVYTSPLGLISIRGDEQHIHAIHFVEEELPESDPGIALLQQARSQLQAYFEGSLKDFELPLQFRGTEFQQRVWSQLQSIPFGKTITYLQLAKALGDPKCIRAAGTANGRNPFAIVVPCHRVVGSNDDLVGYAGGLWRKRWLLDHESGQTTLL